MKEIKYDDIDALETILQNKILLCTFEYPDSVRNLRGFGYLVYGQQLMYDFPVYQLRNLLDSDHCIVDIARDLFTELPIMLHKFKVRLFDLESEG